MNRRTLFAVVLVAIVAVSMTGLLTAEPDLGLRDRPHRDDARRPSREQVEQVRHFHHMRTMAAIVERMSEICFEPEQAVIVAAGDLKDLPGMEADKKADHLEEVLRKIETQGVRNAIHFTLKDLYLAMDKPERAGEHLTAVLVESDRAIQEWREEEGEDDEDEDDEDEDEDEDEDD